MNLGASIGTDLSATSSAGMSSPFSVTGGGGSSAVASAPGAAVTGTGQATGIASWIPWVMVGLVGLALVIFMFKRKRK
ncbi:MAG: LPXTG cell wall anchor domain-containing protein [Verrucomicrobia bacterium]|nr:LPXTG cell wall anchor domain-containing protein [Verrucomicrobiota bacterium]